MDDFKSIEILVNENKELVIFSKTKSNENDNPVKYVVSNHKYELKNSYNVVELSQKIECAFDDWCKYDAYSNKKVTYEENYYQVNGFKNAMKGKMLIDMGWNDIEGKYISLLLPCKRGYTYLGVKELKLSDNATWIDFANGVIELLNLDLSKEPAFKTFKSKFNL